jgi:hypothetical protein
MNETQPTQSEPTAVDDVRRVREAIARQHNGDIRQHMEETNRIFEQLRAALNLKSPVQPPTPLTRPTLEPINS